MKDNIGQETIDRLASYFPRDALETLNGSRWDVSGKLLRQLKRVDRRILNGNSPASIARAVDDISSDFLMPGERSPIERMFFSYISEREKEYGVRKIKTRHGYI